MPSFFYVARDNAGKKITGSEEALSQEELIARLQAKNLLVVSIIAESAKEKTAATAYRTETTGKRASFKHFGVTSEDLVLFCRQLSTLLEAGVSILKSLDIISRQVASRKFHVAIKDLEKTMEAGLSFHEALAKHPKIFSELWINLVESGEASGNLSVILSRLSSYLERQDAFKHKLISSMMYPAILLLAGFGALLFLTLKIIPTFSALFKSFNITLPLLTQILVAASDFIRKYMLMIAGAAGAAFFMFKKYIGTKPGRMQFERLEFKLPLFGDFFRALIVERFSSSMSTLIESGVPILYSLEITERTVGNLVVAEIIRQVKDAVREGRSLSKPLQDSNFFDPMVVQMIAVGEEIGDLPQMFKRINAFYQEHVETFLTRFAALFEPIMLLFMALVIGIMVIGMFLPIFKLATVGGV